MMEILIILLTLSFINICVVAKCMTDLNKHIDELEKNIDFMQYQIDDVLCDINKLANKSYLENLWHDASEEPNRDIASKLIYYIENTDNMSIHTLGKLLECYGEPDLSWNSVVKNLSITKWAYIDDLLPKTN